MEVWGFHFGFCSSGDSWVSLLLLRFTTIPFLGDFRVFKLQREVFFNKQKHTAIMFAGALFYLGNNNLLNKNLFPGSGIYTQEIKSFRQ